MILTQRNWGELEWPSLGVGVGQGLSADTQTGSDGNHRRQILKLCSGAIRKRSQLGLKMLMTGRVKERMAMEPLASYRVHHRHGSAQGQEGIPWASPDRAAWKGYSQATPGPADRGALGEAEQRDQAPAPHTPSWGCKNKVPQMGWLTTTQGYRLTIHLTHNTLFLEPKSPKSTCWQGHAPAETCTENPSLALSSFRWFAGPPWCSLACRWVTPTQCSPRVCLHMDASYMDTSYIGLGAHPTPAWPHLNYLHLQQPCFQMRSHSEVLGVRTSSRLLRGHNSTCNTILRLPSPRPQPGLWCSGATQDTWVLIQVKETHYPMVVEVWIVVTSREGSCDGGDSQRADNVLLLHLEAADLGLLPGR